MHLRFEWGLRGGKNIVYEYIYNLLEIKAAWRLVNHNKLVFFWLISSIPSRHSFQHHSFLFGKKMSLNEPPSTPNPQTPTLAWSTSPPNHLNQPSINLLMNLTSPHQPSQPHLPPSPSISLCYQGTFWARSSTSEVGNGNGTLDGLLSQFLQDIPEEAILKWEKTGSVHNQWRFGNLSNI